MEALPGAAWLHPRIRAWLCPQAGAAGPSPRETNLMGAEVSLLVPWAAQQDGPDGGAAPCQAERPACGAVCLMGTWGPGRGGTHKAHEPEKPR